MSKDVVLHGSKIDWIITEKLEKLREIMDEDATFIQLPQLGSEHTVIKVSGTTLPLIERSIRRMNKLVIFFVKAALTLDLGLLSIYIRHPS
jgi:small-conductance mechanosensitive channel